MTERETNGVVYITDEGNIILDCRFPGIERPRDLDRQNRSQPGVVEHGLFLGLATEAYIAGAGGVSILHG